MSDFITGLRGDLVDAAARDQRRGRLSRAAGPLHPRRWRPAMALGAVAVAAIIAVVVVAASTLAPSPPQAGRPTIVAQLRVGGLPQDAVLAGGSLWVADYSGSVVRVDPARRRVMARIRVGGDLNSIAAGEGRVWVMSTYGSASAPPGSLALRARLTGIDPRTGRVVARVPVDGYGGGIAVGVGGLWLSAHRLIPDQHRPRLQRIDPATSAVTARIAFSRAADLAVGGDSLWALGDEGTVVEVAGVPGAVRRSPRVAAGVGESGGNAITADPTGAWVSSGDGKVLRVEGGDVVREVTVGAAPGALALADRALWVATGDGLQGRFSLKRIDPATGRITATLNLGSVQAKALVPAGRDVWVVAADGTALLVRNRAQAG